LPRRAARSGSHECATKWLPEWLGCLLIDRGRDRSISPRSLVRVITRARCDARVLSACLVRIGSWTAPPRKIPRAARPQMPCACYGSVVPNVISRGGPVQGPYPYVWCLRASAGCPVRGPASRCPTNMAHLRQSRPYSGLGFQVKVFKVSPLRWEAVQGGNPPTPLSSCIGMSGLTTLLAKPWPRVLLARRGLAKSVVSPDKSVVSPGISGLAQGYPAKSVVSPGISGLTTLFANPFFTPLVLD